MTTKKTTARMRTSIPIATETHKIVNKTNSESINQSYYSKLSSSPSVALMNSQCAISILTTHNVWQYNILYLSTAWAHMLILHKHSGLHSVSGIWKWKPDFLIFFFLNSKKLVLVLLMSCQACFSVYIPRPWNMGTINCLWWQTGWLFYYAAPHRKLC